MTTGLRYKCINCNWAGYRSNIIPCPKCGSDVERFLPLQKKRPLTEFEKKFIKQNFKSMLYLDIAKVLCTTESRVCNYINRAGLRLPKKEHSRRKNIGVFKPGQVAWNAGLSLPNIPNSGQFKKGNKPHNTKPIGTINLRRHKRTGENYLYIKITDSHWKPLHQYNWELINGPVPVKHCLRFRDGDTLNCNIENLELVSRRKNLRRNYPAVRPDLIYHNRYIAALLKIKGKKNQDWFIKNHPELIETKRQQLILERGLNETRRTS